MEQLCMNIFDVAKADGNAIRETEYLLSVPGMRESIKAGLAEQPQTLAKALDW